MGEGRRGRQSLILDMIDSPVNASDGIVIRRATRDDVADMIRIGKLSFRHFVNNQVSPEHQAPWLNRLLEATFAEVYVLTVHARVGGFAILVTDEPSFSRERGRYRPPNGAKLLALARSPRLLAVVLAEKCRKLTRAVWALDPDGVHPEAKASAVPMTILSRLAIDPVFRRRGFARHLLFFLEQRTGALGREAISLAVRRQNRQAIALYEACGFIRKSENANWCHFEKSVKACPPIPGGCAGQDGVPPAADGRGVSTWH